MILSLALNVRYTSQRGDQMPNLDQYYTRPEVAQQCWDFLHSAPPLPALRGKTYLEPAVGTGAFYNLMPPSRRIGVELEFEAGLLWPEVAGQDFLTFCPTQTGVITVGNPPFGRNSALAVRFFNHAAAFSTVIAFVVAKSFKKQSMQRRLCSHFHLIREFDLPPHSFIKEGLPHNVPCCFQVWEARQVPRNVLTALAPPSDFAFVKRDHAHLAICRVGRKAGTVRRDFQKYATTSHYFLKSTIDVEVLATRLGLLNFETMRTWTAGPFSLSKQEIILEYVKVLPH
jgi:hypothetical protein